MICLHASVSLTYARKELMRKMDDGNTFYIRWEVVNIELTL